ncbi:MAG: hypothetical protein ACJ8HI_16210 [Massilia sp.]
MDLLIHLGDVPLTFAAAAAIAMWLVCARAWAMALWWSALFILGVGVVAASKIAFLIWGAPTVALPFRALSGHAMGVTAVLIMFLHLLLQAPGRKVGLAPAIGPTAAGFSLGAVMAIMLVVHGDHSVAEAAAGCLIGALASTGAICCGRLTANFAARMFLNPAPPESVASGLAWSALVFISSLAVLHKLPVGYFMYRAAKVVAQHAGMLAMGAH